MRIAQNRAAVSIIRTVALLSLSLVWSYSSSPPCTAQNETPSFHVTTRLVELTVVAIDKNGKPVVDLKKEDFSVFDNGKPRILSVYHYEGGPPAPAAPPAIPAVLQPFVYTNRVGPEAAEERNITALVLDSVNTEARDQMFVKGQTVHLLRALAPQTRVAIYQMGREFRVIHDFTDDMATLRACLEELSLEFPKQRLNDVEQAARDADELLNQIEARKSSYITATFQAVQRADSAAIAGEVNSNAAVRGNRVEATLAALETLGKHLAGVPGRKSVVWISGGFSLMTPRVTTIPNGMPVNPTVGDNMAKVIRKTSERLAQFGVALYAVDARGINPSTDMVADRQEPPLLAGRYSEMERAAGQNSENRAAFNLMASITGGRFIFGTNDFSEGVKKVTDDLHGSYSLGFYLPEEPDGKWHTLRVAVPRSDVHLLYKEGYRLDAAPATLQSWDEEATRRAMMNPLVSDAIRIAARYTPLAGPEPGTLLLTLQIAAEDLFWREESGRMVGGVSIYIGEKTADGKVRYQESRINARFLPRQMETARTQGLPFRHQWKPGVDTLTIRVLVRDSTTGMLGSVDIPLSSTSGNK